MSKLGTVVINEKIFQISNITLWKGAIRFHVALAGPQRFPLNSEVRIHAPDGSLILTSPWTITEKDVRNMSMVTRDGFTYIDIPVVVESVIGWPKESHENR